jgi:hypothetical protein
MWQTNIMFEDIAARLHAISTENLREALFTFEGQNRNRHPDANSEEMREMRNALGNLKNLIGQFGQITPSSDYATKCYIYSEAARFSEYYGLIIGVLFDVNYNSLAPMQRVKIREYIQLLNALVERPPEE